MRLRTIYELFKITVAEWYKDDTFTLGAALAFYTIFAITPIVIVTMTIVGALFGETVSQAEVFDQISRTIGASAAQSLKDVVMTAHAGSSVLTTVIGIGVLLVGATSVFSQLQYSLNVVWGIVPRSDRVWWQVLRVRLLSFVIVLAIGVLLLLSVLVSTALTAFASFVPPESLPGGFYLWRGLQWLVSLAVITVLFMLIYKVLPDVSLGWSDVWVGAAVTALLFNVGKYLIGFYLATSGVASAYGAAGSLVILLMWVFYSTQIFLFGAEFTKAYARYSGKSVFPTGLAATHDA